MCKYKLRIHPRFRKLSSDRPTDANKCILQVHYSTYSEHEQPTHQRLVNQLHTIRSQYICETITQVGHLSIFCQYVSEIHMISYHVNYIMIYNRHYTVAVLTTTDVTRSLAVAKRPCDCCVGQFRLNITGRRYFADIIGLSSTTVT